VKTFLELVKGLVSQHTPVRFLTSLSQSIQDISCSVFFRDKDQRLNKMTQHLIKSDRTIQALKPGVKRMNDGGGLHLRINEDSQVWYQDCNRNGRRTSLSLGPYPFVSLAEARRRSFEMRTDMANGINPSAKRKAQKKGDRERLAARRLLGRQDAEVGMLEHVALQWHAVRKKTWSVEYAKSELSRLKTHVFPALGHRLIADIRREEFTQVLALIDEAGKVSTTGRLYGHCRRICDFAVAKGLLQINVCRDLDEALQTAVTKHHAAITDPETLAEFLKCVDAYSGTFVVVSAMKILIHTFLRSNELRWAKWSEIDLDSSVWRVPAERMKDSLEGKLNRPPQLVPLSSQSLHVLRQLRQITGSGLYVFAGQGWKNPVISENTINKAIRAMGYSTCDEQTAHGFRASSRTILVERLGWHENIVELQLDHVVRDSNGRAYNRTELVVERRKMMQAWSDYLDALRNGRQPLDLPHHGRATGVNPSPSHHEVQQPAFRFSFTGFRGLHQILDQQTG
jgi:integrase